MSYTQPSETIVNQIKKLFYGYHMKFNLYTKEDGYYIDVSDMYEYISFKDDMSILAGYNKIAELLNVTNGEEYDRDCETTGCPTCNYGSEYKLTLHFW